MEELKETGGMEDLNCDNIIIHMDMKAYNEEDNIKMEREFFNGKDIYNSTLSCYPKHSSDMFNNHKDDDSIQLENRYGLRTRKSISVKSDVIDIYKCRDTIEEGKVVENSIFECDKCSLKFNELVSFNNHKNNQVICSVCNCYFCSENVLLNHIETCKGNKNSELIRENHIKCAKCSKLLNTISEYHNCSNTKTFKCEKCKRIFNDESELNHHSLEKQCRNLNGFKCDTCKRVFEDFNVLKRHIAAHLENSLECVNCDECTDGDISLPHLNCESDGAECQGMNLKCLNCNELFSTQEILTEHIVNCSDKVQSCKICSKDFRDSIEYKKHLKIHTKNCRNFKENMNEKSAEHGRESNGLSRKLRYECDTCGKKFLKLSKLQIHILNIHHGVSYECSKCNLKFINQEELDKHTARNCRVEQCSCKTCGKLFTKKDYLKKHEYIHSNVFYRCKFCHCAFMKEKSYNRHVERMNCSKSARKLRLSEFNYKKCRICSVDFEDEELLIQHFGNEHSGENPHQCFCCDSCLPTFKELENHIHLHNTQKYTCHICNKAYTSQEGFRKHRLKHKGAELKCQFCKSEFLNERRFKLHVKTCKKNPESGYDQSQENNSKDTKPKQSRQLHWESRIIMKRLRGDPNSSNIGSDQQNPEQTTAANFFDVPEEEGNDSNVRGWFDDYYKTEEDDFAFGLKKDKKNYASVERKTGSVIHREKLSTEAGYENDVIDGNDVESNSESSDEESDDSSSEEEDEFIENIELPVNYNPKKCRICLITFSHEYELLHHFIKLHPDRKAHKCPNCEVESPLFAQLKEHMKAHGIGIGIYNCDNCSKTYRSEKKMKSHNIRCKGVYAEQYPGSKNAQDGEDCCKRCGKRFQTKCGYRRHKLVCKEKKKANKENKKVGGSSPSYETKVAEVEENVDSPPPVDVQNEVPLQPAETVEVEQQQKDPTPIVFEPPMDSFPCRLCDKKFQYERGIVMHFKSEHPGHKPLVCHICNTHLADKLKEHLKTHGIGEEFICELCGKRFNQKFLSKIHEMWHQGIEYKCSNCKQKFLNKEKMDKHVSENRCSNRQSLMRLPCDICGKSYRSKFGLSKHYITHTPKELRPVKNRMNCEFCGKWFDTNNGLQRHRRIHTGERPFCCRFCSRSFVQEGNCKSHERIHTGEPRPRKKKNASSEPVTYPRDLNPCLFNNVNPAANEQVGLH